MYGLYVPILFLTTTIGILNLYITERILLFYYYKKPPSYDGKLNYRVINILEKVPYFMFFLGYWALSN